MPCRWNSCCRKGCWENHSSGFPLYLELDATLGPAWFLMSPGFASPTVVCAAFMARLWSELSTWLLTVEVCCGTTFHDSPEQPLNYCPSLDGKELGIPRQGLGPQERGNERLKKNRITRERARNPWSVKQIHSCGKGGQLGKCSERVK